MYHPDTGELLLDENQIKIAMAHKTIKQWAYVLHDKDVYTEDDEADNPKHKAGTSKAKHWHIVLQCSQRVEVRTIANWLKIPENFVDIPKGRGAGKFLDCVEYLTHESFAQQALGKYRYPDKEIRASEGFDWRKRLDKRNEVREEYGRDLDETEQMLYDVMYNGKTLRQCEKDDPFIYMDNLDKLKKFRLDYITRMKPPENRINYYIYGKGGVGKDLMSRALARALFPQYEDDEDIFFVVGSGQVTFDGYDGQPVLIWSDRRAGGLIKVLGGRENLFNVFETHPTNQRQNIKYGSINLCNVVNIVNGQETYSEFLDGLAGQYQDRDGTKHKAEDKGQSYRRFPFIIPLYDVAFDLMVNKGYMDNDRRLFSEYYKYQNIRGNMQNIVIACGGENELSRKVSAQAVKPITDKHAEALEKQKRNIDEAAVLKWAAEQGFGKQNGVSSEIIASPELTPVQKNQQEYAEFTKAMEKQMEPINAEELRELNIENEKAAERFLKDGKYDELLKAYEDNMLKTFS